MLTKVYQLHEKLALHLSNLYGNLRVCAETELN